MQTADAYLLLYSITDRASFLRASELRITLRRFCPARHTPIILVGNKCDLVRRREVLTSGKETHTPVACFCLKHSPSGVSLFVISQRAARVPPCLTASSSKPQLPCSTMSGSHSTASCGSCVCEETPGRRADGAGTYTVAHGERASPWRPNAFSTKWLQRTIPPWHSGWNQSPATISRFCSRVSPSDEKKLQTELEENQFLKDCRSDDLPSFCSLAKREIKNICVFTDWTAWKDWQTGNHRERCSSVHFCVTFSLTSSSVPFQPKLWTGQVLIWLWAFC